MEPPGLGVLNTCSIVCWTPGSLCRIKGLLLCKTGTSSRPRPGERHLESKEQNVLHKALGTQHAASRGQGGLYSQNWLSLSAPSSYFKRQTQQKFIHKY